MTVRVATLTGSLIVAHLLLRVALGLGNEAPDLFLVAVLVGSRHLSLRGGAVLGFGVGLIEDSFAMGSFGATVFAMTVNRNRGMSSRPASLRGNSWAPGHYFGLGSCSATSLSWMASEPPTRTCLRTVSCSTLPLMACVCRSDRATVSPFALRGSRRMKTYTHHQRNSGPDERESL